MQISNGVTRNRQIAKNALAVAVQGREKEKNRFLWRGYQL